MNINRDNYEEYFLLNADNELTDLEKAAVLMFVKEHKDLEEEFRMIHYTISRPDTSVHLTDKSFLYRNDTTAFINEKNYEEIFVLYHDNELTENERLETEEFLSVHKALKNEFDLIGLARFTADSSVIFPNKKILYKKEKSGKVVPVVFWRMLAAAVFIGFGLWIANFFFQKPVELKATAANAIPAKNSSPKIEKAILPEKKVTEVVGQASAATDKATVKNGIDKAEKKQDAVSYKNENIVAGNVIDEQKNIEEKVSDSLPGKINDAIMVSNEQIKNIPTEETASLNKIDVLKKLTPAQNTTYNVIENPELASYAKNAFYTPDASNNNQNYVFYDVTTDEFKKTKIGGFLKKIKRVVERNNPITRLLSGDDHQVVSN